jgi:hypothetical protein
MSNPPSGFTSRRLALEHIAMRRPNRMGGSDCLTMPNHPTLKASTLRTILTQAGITRDDFMHAYEQS